MLSSGFRHIVVVEVPIEESLALLLYCREKLSFYGMQQIESHKDILVEVELQIFVLHHVSVKRTLIHQSLLLQPVTIVCIDVSEVTP